LLSLVIDVVNADVGVLHEREVATQLVEKVVCFGQREVKLLVLLPSLHLWSHLLVCFLILCGNDEVLPSCSLGDVFLMLLRILSHFCSLMPRKKRILFRMQLCKANCTEEVILTVMALSISQLHLTIAAVDDQEPLCVAQLCKPLLKNRSLNEIKCLSKQPYLNLLVEQILKLL